MTRLTHQPLCLSFSHVMSSPREHSSRGSPQPRCTWRSVLWSPPSSLSACSCSWVLLGIRNRKMLVRWSLLSSLSAWLIERLKSWIVRFKNLVWAPKIKRSEQIIPNRESKTAYWGEICIVLFCWNIYHISEINKDKFPWVLNYTLIIGPMQTSLPSHSSP